MSDNGAQLHESQVLLSAVLHFHGKTLQQSPVLQLVTTCQLYDTL